MSSSELATYCPKNQQEWRLWLEKNHHSENSIWLIIYKKHTEHENLTWSQAVDQALCFGWIDSTKRPIDDEKYMQYFGKRKAKSNWSKINKEKIEVLTKAGLMTKAGIKSIEIAKQNGSWNILDEVEALIIPKELQIAFNQNPASEKYYSGLSNSLKKQLLYLVISAKRAETKAKRVNEIIDSAKQGLLPKQMR